jgi:membrane fusion protein, multidrug efflux system
MAAWPQSVDIGDVHQMSTHDAQTLPGLPPARPAASRPGFVWRLFWGDRWLRLAGVTALVLLVVAPFAVWWVIYRLTHSITDDAFVETHVVNVAPQEVSGHLVRYLVQEQDIVAAGQLLAEIDPIPYHEQVALLEAKLGVAQAQLAASQTTLERLRAQVPREIEVAQRALAAAQAEQSRDEKTLQFTTEDTEKGIHEARSDLEAARARLDLAEKDYTRYSRLFAAEAATQRESQVATRTFQTSQADVKASEARLGRALAGEKKVAAARQTAVASVQQAHRAEQAVEVALTQRLEITEAERQVEVNRQQVGQARRALDVAKTDLRYTRIVAPFPGVIVHLYRHLGDHVPAGTPVLSMYNPELTYVTANLEESKLEGVAPGNRVRLDVVAFSEPFLGRVVWINKATGANFALVPRNLSSGEFTYVVQRVPVRILVEKDDRWPQLRAGLSVTVSIEHGQGDAKWAKQAADEMRALESTVKPNFNPIAD